MYIAMEMDALISKPVLIPALVAVLAVCVIGIVVRLSGNREKKRKYHPVGGTIFHFVLNFRRLYDYLTDLAHKNTTFRILYLDNTEIYTSDPANIEYFLKTNFSNYGKVLLCNSWF